mmetsp:Transcript_31197/g.47782  ORF Transcript_31197/g.47782 Transcript_31197/m.47782 type:complete len:968 (-) Transcript_31197:195-3098(-)|eukprot:CAMPEP_0195285870 /NCGR_PEP_ID=MMETSP0707-20130614/3540_1 /TAXON_ID=33640 /ORGANISM="Asterionellopsis glacialis, Strain CCMP134" /LENGTH=967 /DNA_ID=CAMNT_0040345427 /DNA_START=40 /DNA_END=2943 /DNA_ORIENTATION=+
MSQNQHPRSRSGRASLPRTPTKREWIPDERQDTAPYYSRSRVPPVQQRDDNVPPRRSRSSSRDVQSRARSTSRSSKDRPTAMREPPPAVEPLRRSKGSSVSGRSKSSSRSARSGGSSSHRSSTSAERMRIENHKTHSDGYAPRRSRSVSRSRDNHSVRSGSSGTKITTRTRSISRDSRKVTGQSVRSRSIDRRISVSDAKQHSDGYAPRRSRSISRDASNKRASSMKRSSSRRARDRSRSASRDGRSQKSSTSSKKAEASRRTRSISRDSRRAARSPSADRSAKARAEQSPSLQEHLAKSNRGRSTVGPPRTERPQQVRGTSVSSRGSRGSRSRTRSTQGHTRSSSVGSRNGNNSGARGFSTGDATQHDLSVSAQRVWDQLSADDWQENLPVQPSAPMEAELTADETAFVHPPFPEAEVIDTPVVAIPVSPNNVGDIGYDVKPFLRPPSPSRPAFVDPFASATRQDDQTDKELFGAEVKPGTSSGESTEETSRTGASRSVTTRTVIRNFLGKSNLDPNLVDSEEDISRLRLFAGRLSADWGDLNLLAPDVARRIRDFQYAQEKRRKKYGDERPWGILGLYDHLSGIRLDVEWAEDAAWRRLNGEPYLSWADFEASKKKGNGRPFFTYFALFICTILLIASIALNGWTVERFTENPMIGPSAYTLIRMGAKDTYLIVNEGEAWRLVSSVVLHAGLIHYCINMLALWFVGCAIEMNHGFIATTIVFFIPAVGGTIFSALFLPEYITVGASGGIFGLIGACLADISVNWKLLFNDHVTENGKKHHHALVVAFLLLDIVLNSIIGLTPYVDNFTHLGGMVLGYLCGLSTMERLPTQFFGIGDGCMSQTKQLVVRFFGLILSIITLAITLVILLEGDGQTNPCPSCTWLSCVPFPPWADDTQKWWYCDDCGTITADIVQTPTLHLAVDCPNGETVAVPLDSENTPSRSKLESDLPDYCREYCPEVYSDRFRL